MSSTPLYRYDSLKLSRLYHQPDRVETIRGAAGLISPPDTYFIKNVPSLVPAINTSLETSDARPLVIDTQEPISEKVKTLHKEAQNVPSTEVSRPAPTSTSVAISPIKVTEAEIVQLQQAHEKKSLKRLSEKNKESNGEEESEKEEVEEDKGRYRNKHHKFSVT